MRCTAMKCITRVFCLLSLISMVRAQSLPVGTWVRRPNNDSVNATLLIEAAGTGRKLTFKAQVAGGASTTMVVTTQMDGKDAQVSVDGKPSGQTMAMRMLDDRHIVNVLKINGNTMATQKSEISPDGKMIKTDTTASVPGQQNGTEYWDKK